MNAPLLTKFVPIAALFCLGTPPVEAQDTYEPNDSKATATLVKDLKNSEWKEISGVTYHTGSDEDWFNIVTTKKGSLDVEVIFSKNHQADLMASDDSPLTGDFEPGRIVLAVGNLDAGNYFLNLRNLGEGTGDVTLRIRYSDPTTYRGWLLANSEPANLPSNADPNGDGTPLGLEWVFNRPPNPDPSSWGPLVTPLRGGLGVIYVVSLPFEGLRQPVTLEMSTDLKKWSPVPKENFPEGAQVNPIPKGESGRVDVFFRYGDLGDHLYLRIATEKVE